MVLTLYIVTLVLLVIHAILIETYRHWFLKMKPFVLGENEVATTRFSIIIPARNEEAQIENCLLSVLSQTYPNTLFEVIVVDDYSTDNTAAIVTSLQEKYPNLSLIQLEKLPNTKLLNSYKKKAIELAIQQAAGDFIVTTDADCIVNKKWLQNLDAYIRQTGAVFVAAPVKFTDNKSFVSRFQCLDFMSLQGITAAAVAAGFHSMCNGANLAYSKQVFNEVGGFKGIDNIASGDDMMLMHKIVGQHKKGVQFLFSPEVVVCTEPMPTWKDFLNQRIRWASKADKFDDKRIIAVLAFVYLFNLSFIVVPIVGFWHLQPDSYRVWYWWLAMLIFKTVIELRFMWPVANFFQEKQLLKWFVVMQPFHICYTIIAGWLGKFGNYQWKGRKVK